MKGIITILTVAAILCMASLSYAAELLSYGVTPGEAERGAKVVFDAFAEGVSGISVEVDGQTLAMANVGDRFEAQYTIPADAALGEHTATITADGSQASVSFVVK